MKKYLMPSIAISMILAITTNLNSQWVQVTGSVGGPVNCIGINGTDIYAGTPAGLFRTKIGGNWSAITGSMPFPITVFSAIPHGSGDTAYIIGTFGGGIFRSTDKGVTWDSVNNGMSNRNITSFASYTKGPDTVNLFAGTSGGLFLSTDMGASWSDKISGFFYKHVQDLAAKANNTGGTDLFASIFAAGVLVSTDNGTSWIERNNGIPSRKFTNSFTFDDSSMYVGFSNTIYRSIDTGHTWTALTSLPTPGGGINSILHNGEFLFVSDGVHVWRSADQGGSWFNISNGLPKYVAASITMILSLASMNPYIICGTYAGAFISSDNGSTWSNMSHGLDASPINAFSVSGSRIFAAGGSGYYLFRSTDNGGNWISCLPQNDTVYLQYNSIASNDDWVLLGSSSPERGTYGGPMMRNTVQWGTMEGIGYHYASSLAISDYYIYSGGAGVSAGVARCPIDDTTWTIVSNGLLPSSLPETFAANGSNVFAATRSNGLYYSPNSGGWWYAVNNGLDTTKRISAIAINGPNIFVGSRTIPLSIMTSNGVYRSTNNGVSWEEANTGLTDTNIYALAVSNTRVFAGTESKGVFFSADNGATWQSFNEGLSSLNIYSLALNDTYIFAGLMGGIWRRTLSEAVVSVPPDDNNLPAAFNLSQNYPNPFNPITTISFSMPVKSYVSVKIFDLLGKEAATIISAELPAGNYSRQWNAANFSSGVYFYRLESGSYSQTKKLILLK